MGRQARTTGHASGTCQSICGGTPIPETCQSLFLSTPTGCMSAGDVIAATEDARGELLLSLANSAAAPSVATSKIDVQFFIGLQYALPRRRQL
jgi:hypothetical protein